MSWYIVIDTNIEELITSKKFILFKTMNLNPKCLKFGLGYWILMFTWNSWNLFEINNYVDKQQYTNLKLIIISYNKLWLSLVWLK